VVVHAAVEAVNQGYRAAGVRLPGTRRLDDVTDPRVLAGALVVAPATAADGAGSQRLGPSSTAFASGWMQLSAARRRRRVDRGFVLSDHADWSGLQRAVAATGAQRVIVTHGYESVMVRWLNEQGLRAESFRTEYGLAHEPFVETANASTPSPGPAG